MKRILTIIALAVLIPACSWNNPDIVKPEQQVAESVKYVVKIPPKELMTLPEVQKKLDVDTAKQSDIARWIISTEIRTKALENQIIGIASFFNDEQSKLDEQAKSENTKAANDAIDAQAGEAKAAISKEVK
jgi:hypothetical protein